MCAYVDVFFHNHHFISLIIILFIRWYIPYKLSYHGLQEVMANRGTDLIHTTILL